MSNGYESNEIWKYANVIVDRRDIASILKLDAIFKTAYPRRWNKAEEESSSVLEIIFERLEEAFQTNKRWKSTIFVSFPVDIFASRNLLLFFFHTMLPNFTNSSITSLKCNYIPLPFLLIGKRDKMGCGWFWKIKNMKCAIIKEM